MNENNKKTAMLNGLVVGGMMSIKFLLGTSTIVFIGFLGLIVSVGILVLLYRFAIAYRGKENEGTITYKQAFGFIFQVYFYGSIVLSLIVLLYTTFINQTYLESMTNEMLKMYDKINFPVDDELVTMMETMYKPAPFALLNLFVGGIVGAFWASIFAAFIKKEKSIFE